MQGHYDRYGIGVSMGNLKKDRLSWSITLKSRTHWLLGTFDIDYDMQLPTGENFLEKEVNYYGASVWKIRYTRKPNDENKKTMIGTVGLTQKLFYPLWLNVGLGAGYFQNIQYVNEEHYVRIGNDYEWQDFKEYYIEENPYTKYGLVWEAGLKLVLAKKIVLGYGFTNGHEEIYQYFNLGFTF